jgi:hypothetical protein
MTATNVLELRVDPPRRQHRATVLFRVLLAIPHAVVLGVLGYAAAIATFMAWFAVLVLGRNPFHKFVAGYLRWSIRVNGYLYLLTDRYPPFELSSDPAFPVDVDLAQGDLSRVTVFFRLLLMIPALILTSVLRLGMAPIVFVAWVVTLIRGSLPPSLHQAFEATLRFDARFAAYAFLLQDPYPRGLFGDGAAPLDAPLPPPPVPSAPAVPAPETAPPGYSWPPEVDTPALTPVGAPGGAPWRVVLSGGARRIVITEIALGFLGYVVWIPLVAILIGSSLGDRIWALAYRGDVSTLSSAVTVARQELSATHPDWALLSMTCGANGTVAQALALLGPTTPAYPTADTNKYLVTGLEYVTLADAGCNAAVSQRAAAVLPDVDKLFARGASQLEVFLSKIPS